MQIPPKRLGFDPSPYDHEDMGLAEFRIPEDNIVSDSSSIRVHANRSPGEGNA